MTSLYFEMEKIKQQKKQVKKPTNHKNIFKKLPDDIIDCIYDFLTPVRENVIDIVYPNGESIKYVPTQGQKKYLRGKKQIFPFNWLELQNLLDGEFQKYHTFYENRKKYYIYGNPHAFSKRLPKNEKYPFIFGNAVIGHSMNF